MQKQSDRRWSANLFILHLHLSYHYSYLKERRNAIDGEWMHLFSLLWGRTKSSCDFHFIPWPFVWFPFGWEDEAISNASRTSKISRSYAEVGRARSKPKERGEKKYLKINQNIKEKKENLYITFNFRKEQKKKSSADACGKEEITTMADASWPSLLGASFTHMPVSSGGGTYPHPLCRLTCICTSFLFHAL